MTSASDSIQCAVESMTTSWLQHAKDGDNAAWDKLNRVYRKLVVWWCLKSSVPRDDAEDIGQEVFISVRRGLETYSHESFRGWLWTITKTRITDFWRRHNKQPAARGGSTVQDLLQEVEAQSSQDFGPTDQATKILFDQIVRLVESEFNKTHWRAFWMRIVEDKSAGEVSDALGVSRTVVHNATSRIRRRINDEFGEAMNVTQILAKKDKDSEDRP